MLNLVLLLAQSSTTLPFDLVEQDPLAGIKIIYERDGMMDLDLWSSEYDYPVVKTVSPLEINRARQALRKAFAKYPQGFIKKHLDRVYVTGDLVVDGFEYGATYAERSLYIVDGGVAEGFDDRFLEQSFHHEFSSVLFLDPALKFPRQEWSAINPKTFYYKGYDDVYADKKSEVDWEEQRKSWLRMGLVKKYSLTSMEEDLNTVAESVFAGGRKFWAQADRYPKVLAKARLLIGFFRRLDPWFGEARIRSYR